MHDTTLDDSEINQLETGDGIKLILSSDIGFCAMDYILFIWSCLRHVCISFTSRVEGRWGCLVVLTEYQPPFLFGSGLEVCNMSNFINFMV